MRYAFFICAVLLAAAAVYSDDGAKRRGKYLRTEVRSTEATEGYSVRLVENKTSFLSFEFRRVLTLKIHEVRMYETVMEKVTPNSGEGITQRGAVDYVVVPGELFEGEHSERIEKKDDGPLKLEIFTFGGKTYYTDESGIWIDQTQEIIAMFDNMRAREETLKFTHKEYGDFSLVLTRNMIRRQKAVMPGGKDIPQEDMLEALGMDFTQLKLSSPDGVVLKVVYKNKAAPGEIVAVTFEAKNNGMRSVSNMMGRSFSSVPSLDGKLFYFGMIPPGQKRSFSRLLAVPQVKGPCYVKVAFWNLFGAMKKIEQRICIEVE